MFFIKYIIVIAKNIHWIIKNSRLNFNKWVNNYKNKNKYMKYIKLYNVTSRSKYKKK